ncbi:recombinase family protein [Runella sp. MFBS21]|uniref:recombinase family protein n=1 Tax=Runella sp. MFBS21 TaxID=3034018 RepID=UPI0023F6AC83|nr:recombinase family protein [Runella sp. MFBS21]MDF7821871.1 recombinase family protein [Runella sp. MFBS21]
MQTVGFTQEIRESSPEMSAIKTLTENILIGEYKDLESILHTMQVGDCLVVYKLSQLGNNIAIINKNVQLIIEKGIHLKSLAEGIDSASVEGKRQVELIAHLAEQTIESLTKSRKKAVEKGTKFGPAKGAVYKYEDIAPQVYQMYLDKKHTIEEIRTHFGIGSRGTVYKIIKRFENLPQ